MKITPNKLLTIRANFADGNPDLEKDIQSISARLYRGDEHITDLSVIRQKPLLWNIHHIFPIDSQMGEYQAIVEVKIKDQKEPIIQEETISLVRDINLNLKTNIGNEPQVIINDEYQEVPSDIKSYLVKKNV